MKRTTTELNINYLTGTWKYTSKLNHSLLVLYKTSNTKKSYDEGIMKFSADGKMSKQLSGNSRKCGNDRSSNRYLGGNWTFDKEHSILTIKFGKFSTTEYEILELSSNKLILKRIIR
ncbi:lipocalin family protein [Winogradskyella pulchriflava]|uniref:Lipocalin family protein n=1 Tax=Winogradskyella pulchriflava TaxID=1110688 RepID=A0ABV6QBB9_9FLAO